MEAGAHATVMTDLTDALSPEKRVAILRGAAAVFASHGYEGASMSRIAAAADVSKGTLYNYFEGKAELFAAWIGRECEQNIARIFEGAGPESEPAAGLRAIGERMLQMMMSETGLTIYRLTVSEAAKFPELARAFYQHGPSRATRSMTVWLEGQISQGTMQIADPAFAAEQFFALCQTRVGLLIRLGLSEIDDATLARVVDTSVTMFLNTYGVPRHGDPSHRP